MEPTGPDDTKGPPRAHTARAVREVEPEELAEWTFRPIGVVRSPYRHVHDAPRQGVEGEAEAEIVLRRGMQNCVRDLAGMDRLWVVFVFSYARGWRPTLVPPRDSVHRGVLSTRAPHRPNPVGLTCARLLEVRGRRLRVAEHDLLDGTPVLDLKPYVAAYDAHPGARAGWVDGLDPSAPDHRWR